MTIVFETHSECVSSITNVYLYFADRMKDLQCVTKEGFNVDTVGTVRYEKNNACKYA